MYTIIIQTNSICHCNMGLCTMSFKRFRQHVILSLFFGIVNSSNVTDYNFNIEYGKRIVGQSTNIGIQTVSSKLDCAITCTSQHACCSASFDNNTGICSLNSQCSPQLEQYSDSMIITKILSGGKSINFTLTQSKEIINDFTISMLLSSKYTILPKNI